MKNMIAVMISLIFVGCSLTPPGTTRVSNSNIEDHYKAMSSGFIGCFREDITIENIEYSYSISNDIVLWKATCKDQLFYCSKTTGQEGLKNISTQIACTKEL